MHGYYYDVDIIYLVSNWANTHSLESPLNFEILAGQKTVWRPKLLFSDIPVHQLLQLHKLVYIK